MSDVIRLLPDSVANQIAAGEVIQRPASAIKELVENAADAGATEIKIVVKDAGKTMIQVIDNGCGMSETDARMAFERHATSKIRQADDLFTLHTMGFRGEALPSICAISEVEVKTRRAEDSIGTRLVIVGSKVELQEPCMCDKGTVFTVKKLFFNVPARRKFLKSDSVELSNIVKEFERMALVNNHLRLSLDTGNRVIDLRAGSFRQRIVDLWKSNLDSQLLPVEVDTSIVKIEGFVSRPEFARRRNPLQFLIANGRNMNHGYFKKAILGCYEKLIAPDTQPCFFLKFTVDPQNVDVNRSPTKDDIKFEYEQQIWPILQAAVKASLGKYSAVPSIDFSSDALQVIPPKEGEEVLPPTLGVDEGYNPFNAFNQDMPAFTGQSSFGGKVSSSRRAADYERKTGSSGWEKLYDNFKNRNNSESADFQKEEGFEQPYMPENDVPESVGTLFEEESKEKVAPICLQYAGKYIVTPSREGIMIIDQHRAHVKILYEEYLRRVEQMEVVSQSVMFPETVMLDESQRAALEEIGDDLKRLGFSLEYESGERWSITSLPAMLKKGNHADIVLRILDSVTEDSVNYGKDAKGVLPIASKAALLMARSSAIRRGEKLSVADMENLIGRLFTLPDPAFTPNGNPVFFKLEEEKIDKMFKH